jgi:hypothetical protein
VILPPRKVPLQVLRRTLEASGNKRRSLAIPHGRPHAVGCGLDRAGAGSSATRTGPGLERSAATEALPRGSHLSGGELVCAPSKPSRSRGHRSAPVASIAVSRNSQRNMLNQEADPAAV